MLPFRHSRNRWKNERTTGRRRPGNDWLYLTCREGISLRKVCLSWLLALPLNLTVVQVLGLDYHSVNLSRCYWLSGPPLPARLSKSVYVPQSTNRGSFTRPFTLLTLTHVHPSIIGFTNIPKLPDGSFFCRNIAHREPSRYVRLTFHIILTPTHINLRCRLVESWPNSNLPYSLRYQESKTLDAQLSPSSLFSHPKCWFCALLATWWLPKLAHELDL